MDLADLLPHNWNVLVNGNSQWFTRVFNIAKLHCYLDRGGGREFGPLHPDWATESLKIKGYSLGYSSKWIDPFTFVPDRYFLVRLCTKYIN